MIRGLSSKGHSSVMAGGRAHSRPLKLRPDGRLVILTISSMDAITHLSGLTKE